MGFAHKDEGSAAYVPDLAVLTWITLVTRSALHCRNLELFGLS